MIFIFSDKDMQKEPRRQSVTKLAKFGKMGPNEISQEEKNKIPSFRISVQILPKTFTEI